MTGMKCPECGSPGVTEKGRVETVKIYARIGQSIPETKKEKIYHKIVCDGCKWASPWELISDVTYEYDLSSENLRDGKFVVDNIIRRR